MIDFRDRLDFIKQEKIKDTNDDVYLSARKNLASSYNEIMEHLRNVCNLPEENMNVYVTTRIKNSIYDESTINLMVLDCDSDEDKDMACRYLDGYSVRYYPIESSPNHFWIVCDFIGSICQIIQQMKLIPGIDKRYVLIGEKKSVLNIRAFPKKGVIPIFNQKIPEKKFAIDSYVQWIEDFVAYWLNEDMVSIYKEYYYNWSLKNSSVIQDMVRERVNKDVEEKVKQQKVLIRNIGLSLPQIDSPFDRMEIG